MCAVNWILKQIKQIMTLIKLICDLMENKDVAAYLRSPVSVNYTWFPWKVQETTRQRRSTLLLQRQQISFIWHYTHLYGDLYSAVMFASVW